MLLLKAIAAGMIAGLLTGLLMLVVLSATSPASSAEPISREDRIAILSASTAMLEEDDERTCTASKVAPGMFLTAQHCVSNWPNDKYKVVYKKDSQDYGQSREVKSMHIGGSQQATGGRADWAILYTEQDIEDMKSLTVACAYVPKIGANVAAMGYPYPMGRYYSEGYINSVDKTVLPKEDIGSDFFADIRVAGGSSGGPVVDSDTGQQIGITVELIVPGRAGNIASGIQGVGVSAVCKVLSIPAVVGGAKTNNQGAAAVSAHPVWYDGASPF